MENPTGTTGGKCPFPHLHGSTPKSTPTSAGGRSNRDWWPNQLNLKMLHQNSALSDPMGADFDYAKAFKVEPVEAYGPLMIDAMRGDQSLFKHRLEVESAWHAIMPFLDERSAAIRRDIHRNPQTA